VSGRERGYPAPTINVETRPFWAATKEGRLLIGRCRACAEPHFYPRTICPHCGKPEVDWVAASGTGRIYSYSIMRRAETPYAIAYVALEEGVTLLSNLVDCDFERLAVGQSVTLAWRDAGPDARIPVFTPD
jgi:uncharacterized protein